MDVRFAVVFGKTGSPIEGFFPRRRKGMPLAEAMMGETLDARLPRLAALAEPGPQDTFNDAGL